jgi:large subunit ribosomal protein L22
MSRKTKRIKQNFENSRTARAELKNVWISPQKTRLVADLIRNKSAVEAIKILTFTRKKAAGLLLGVVESALANAENEATQKDLELNIENLYISTIYVNKGPVQRRFRPRARGMYNRVNKHTSHILVTLTEKEPEA